MIVPGAIGAPKDKIKIIKIRITKSFMPICIPQILPKNKLIIVRQTQLPSMFIVAPRGITNDVIFCGIPN